MLTDDKVDNRMKLFDLGRGRGNVTGLLQSQQEWLNFAIHDGNQFHSTTSEHPGVPQCLTS